MNEVPGLITAYNIHKLAELIFSKVNQAVFLLALQLSFLEPQYKTAPFCLTV